MKTRHFILFLPLLAAAASCEDRAGTDSTQQDPVFAYWEQPHSAMAGLAGNVESVIEYTVEEGMRFPLSYMVFNGKGGIASYDPTGMSVPESFIEGGSEAEGASAATKAGFFATSRYEFSYDATGRVASVKKYDMMPEPVAEYTFAYGDAGVYAPLDITGTGISLVARVLSVRSGYIGDAPDPEASSSFLFEARDGGAYTCLCEGTSDAAVVRESEIAYEGSLPVLETAVYYSGTGAGRVRTADETVTYTWDSEKGILLSCVTEKRDADGTVTKSEDRYSTTFPMKKTYSATWAGETLRTELRYTYDSDGRLLESVYTPGYEGFGSDIMMEYTAFDVYGNWTGAVRTSSDGQYSVFREITCFEE